MRNMVMYQENLEPQIGNDVICQEICIIRETESRAIIELYSMYRNTDGKCVHYPDTRTVRGSENFDIAVSVSEHAGFKPVEYFDSLVNIYDEDATIYEMENGEAVFLFGNHISRKFKSADDAADFLYRKGFRY